MQHSSPTPPTLLENFSTSTISNVTSTIDTSYVSQTVRFSPLFRLVWVFFQPSLLLKKKLAMFEHSSPTTVDNDMSNETINSSESVSSNLFRIQILPIDLFLLQTIKSSNTNLPSMNENEPVKSASRVYINYILERNIRVCLIS